MGDTAAEGTAAAAGDGIPTGCMDDPVVTMGAADGDPVFDKAAAIDDDQVAGVATDAGYAGVTTVGVDGRTAGEAPDDDDTTDGGAAEGGQAVRVGVNEVLCPSATDATSAVCVTTCTDLAGAAPIVEATSGVARSDTTGADALTSDWARF